MQDSKFDISAFITRTELVFALPLPQILRSLLHCYQYSIGIDLGQEVAAIFKCKKKYTEFVSKELSNAIKSMKSSEKIQFYYAMTDSIFKLFNGNIEFASINTGDLTSQGFIRNSKSRIWKKKQIIYNALNHVIYISSLKDSKKIVVNLAQYLYRKSKNLNYKAFALQACDKRVPKQRRSICIGFESVEQFNSMFSKVKHSINYRQWEYIKAMYDGDPLTKNSINSMRRQSFCEVLKTQQMHENEQQFFTCQNLQQVCNQNIEQSCDGYQKKLQVKQRDLNVVKNQQNKQLHKKCIDDQLQQSSIPNNFLQISSTNLNDEWVLLTGNQQFKLLEHKQKQVLQLQIVFNQFVPIEQLQSMFLKYPSKCVSRIVKVGESQHKQILSIECVRIDEMMKQTSFNIQRRLIKQTHEEIVYHQITITPNNIQNIKYEAMWAFSSLKNKNSKLILLMSMSNKQYSGAQQNLKFNISYLKGVFQNFSIFYSNKSTNYFHFFNDHSLAFDPINKSVKVKHACKSNDKYQMSALRKGHHQQLSIQSPQKCLSVEWRRDEEKGGLQYLNFDKIAAQKGVIKHIVGQMGRNLFSGKSMLNLSLPVQIFLAQSHLQRLLHSFRMAPTFFEEYEGTKGTHLKIEQLQQLLASSAAFGISTSLLYLSQQKSFNPMLGETSQMWIDGCPAYAEQISHHPPISSVYFIGRGYKIYGQLQAKFELGLNTGKGSNSGQMVIEFDSGLKICNYFSPGEVSGLSYGKRKFNLIGKSYHFIANSNVYLQLDFENNKKRGKNTQDQIKGIFYETSMFQIEEFRKHQKFKNLKIHKPLDYSKKLSGIWSKYIQYQQKMIINFETAEVPNMNRDSFPLPSDSVWRSDIAHKRLKNEKQAQQFKQILEENQRRDRKLRSH